MDDYATVISVWLEAGLQLSSSDSRNGLKQKLTRDPDLFLVAEEDLIGQMAPLPSVLFLDLFAPLYDRTWGR
jgi:hypothetical protein